MIDADEFYKKIDRHLVGELKSTGQVENSFWQHIGHYINHDFATPGYTFTNMLGDVERLMTGQNKHGFEQNKKTDLEKLIEKGANNGTGN